jgi:hypothetical protein
MKKLLIASLIFVSCEDKKLPVKPVDIEDTSITTMEYKYDSCEYVAFAAGRYRWGSHKGNCKNPIHKQQ